MITNIEIKNFKRLKYFKTEIKDLNVLMGLNGMGKSTFIQMLLIIQKSFKSIENFLDLNIISSEISPKSDFLYEFAENDIIEFNLILNKCIEIKLKILFKDEKPFPEINAKFEGKKNNTLKDNFINFQYINAERIGPRNIYSSPNPEEIINKQIGNLGEYVGYFINEHSASFEVNEFLLHQNSNTNKLNSQLNAWLKEISPGISITTKNIPEINKFLIEYYFEKNNSYTKPFKPKNVGFGISYVLPVILTLLTAKEGKIIIIENPESHIHPRGQSELGKLIALAAQTKAQIFIETHSEHILNGIRLAIKEFHSKNKKGIDKDKVNIMYFDKKNEENEQFSVVTSIKVDKDGDLSEYPIGFLDEWSNQLLKLL